MSIYPQTRVTDRRQNADGTETWVEEEHTPGLIRRRRVTAEKWVEERTDCYCCSCDPDRPGSDPYCRNHGFAGERPCETHGMPGSPDEDGRMPESVQRSREERVERLERQVAELERRLDGALEVNHLWDGS